MAKEERRSYRRFTEEEPIPENTEKNTTKPQCIKDGAEIKVANYGAIIGNLVRRTRKRFSDIIDPEDMFQELQCTVEKVYAQHGNENCEYCTTKALNATFARLKDQAIKRKNRFVYVDISELDEIDEDSEDVGLLLSLKNKIYDPQEVWEETQEFTDSMIDVIDERQMLEDLFEAGCVTENQIEAYLLHKQGMTLRDIAAQLGVGKSTIGRWVDIVLTECDYYKIQNDIE